MYARGENVIQISYVCNKTYVDTSFVFLIVLILFNNWINNNLTMAYDNKIVIKTYFIDLDITTFDYRVVGLNKNLNF